MIEAQHHLTIKEAKYEIKKLENQLDLYLTKKEINKLKIQPKAIQIKDIVVDSSHVNFDKYLDYVIKDEEIDTTLYELLSSILSYKQYIAKEIISMSKYDEIGYIAYLKEEEGKSWREIDKILHHGEGYSKLKFMRYKKEKNKSSSAIDTV